MVLWAEWRKLKNTFVSLRKDSSFCFLIWFDSRWNLTTEGARNLRVSFTSAQRFTVMKIFYKVKFFCWICLSLKMRKLHGFRKDLSAWSDDNYLGHNNQDFL